MVVHKALPAIDPRIEQYCQQYRSLFTDPKDFRAFQALHVGLISDLERKSLLKIAKTFKLASYKSLLHLINGSSWQAQALRRQRLTLTLQLFRQQTVTLVIEEQGIRKDGEETDYLTRQYFSNLDRSEKGLVVLIAYVLLQNIEFPVAFKIFKPRERLKSGDTFKTKAQLAVSMIENLLAIGFNVDTVLLDAFSDEDQDACLKFIDSKLYLDYVITVRCNQRGWTVRQETDWEYDWIEVELIGCKFNLFLREGILHEQSLRCWEAHSTGAAKYFGDFSWILLTNMLEIDYRKVSQYYCQREWIAYITTQVNDKLGWEDFQMTKFEQIERWWEIIMSVHLMESLSSTLEQI